MSTEPETTPVSPEPVEPESAPTKRRPRWIVPAVVGVVALAAGVGIGSAVGGSPTESQEYRDLQSQHASLKEEVDTALSALNKTASERDAAQTQLAAAIEREEELAAREAAAQRLEDELSVREAAVTATEAQAAANTITEGTWTVGVDIEPGTYRTDAAIPGGGHCYWSITRTGTNGDEILQNDIVTGGRPSVTLSEGQDFTTRDCGSWVRQ